MKQAWIILLVLVFPAFGADSGPKVTSGWKPFKSTLCYSFRYPKDWGISVNDDMPKPKYSDTVELDSPFQGPPWTGFRKEHMNCEFARDFIKIYQDLATAARYWSGTLLREGKMTLGGQPAYEAVFRENTQISRIIVSRDKKGSAHESIEIICQETGTRSEKMTSDKQWKYAATVDQVLSTFRFLDCPAKKK